jgi:hypothetical protein
MKRKIILSATLFLLVDLLIGCGNAKTKEAETGTENKIENIKPDKPVVSFMLDGRLIESAEYSCSWQLSDKVNMFTFNVLYDREPKNNPPNLGFAIYNLKDITLLFSPLNGKLPGKTEQSFSLAASLGLPKGKAADMNELSFSDNYKGLASVVQLSFLDTTAKRVSGRFEGVIQNANGKTMKIEKGQFERIPLKMLYNY